MTNMKQVILNPPDRSGSKIFQINPVVEVRQSRCILCGRSVCTALRVFLEADWKCCGSIHYVAVMFPYGYKRPLRDIK